MLLEWPTRDLGGVGGRGEGEGGSIGVPLVWGGSIGVGAAARQDSSLYNQ